MSEHIVNGQFQSDKYHWCKPGFVPLKITDPTAWSCLLNYAEKRASVDPEFSADLKKCVDDALDAALKEHQEKYGMKEVDALLGAVQDANEDKENT